MRMSQQLIANEPFVETRPLPTTLARWFLFSINPVNPGNSPSGGDTSHKL